MCTCRITDGGTTQMLQRIDLRPQQRQEQFLSSPADIVIYGGAAGGGKTWSLLVEPLRHWRNGQFGAVIFRRTLAEVIKTGGLWDEATRLYSLFGARKNDNERWFQFASGARVTFGHLQYDDTVDEWKSAQIALLEFDQLETFSERQFFYMLSRNRSMCGVRPYVRATCNPEPGWLADFLAWWIDEDGYASLERSGVIRWMVRANEQIEWFATEYQAREAFPDVPPKSVAFVLATVYDNQILLGKDPGYLANLKALPLVDRERLLGDTQRGGNWKIKPSAGKVFNRAWFGVVPAAPSGGQTCIFWDFAATEKSLAKPDPDYTAAVTIRKVGGRWYVLDCQAFRAGPAEVERAFVNLSRQMAERARAEGSAFMVRWEQEPGSASKREAARLAHLLSGLDARAIVSQGDKIARARAMSAQAEAGNISLVEGVWNEEWLNHMHGQPDLPHDDIMDASAGAFNALQSGAGLAEFYLKELEKINDGRNQN